MPFVPSHPVLGGVNEHCSLHYALTGLWTWSVRVLAEKERVYSYSESVVEMGHDSLGKQWHEVQYFWERWVFSIHQREGCDSVFLTDMGKREVETTLTKSSMMQQWCDFQTFSTLLPKHRVSKVLGEVIIPYKGHYGLPSLSPGSAHAHWAFSLWPRQSFVPRLGWRPPISARLTSPERTKTSRFILFVNNHLWYKYHFTTTDQ